MLASLYTIDHGNNHCSVGEFRDGSLTRVCPFDEIPLKNSDSIIYSSVGKKRVLPGLNASTFFVEGHFLGMPVHYTPSLGTDRVTLGRYFYRGRKTPPTLIVDAGTFITMDIISREGFMGGLILPGLDVYLESFSKASTLPVLSKEKLFSLGSPSPLAHNTEEAIAYGPEMFLGSLFKAILNHDSRPERVYLTGGDGKRLVHFFPSAEVINHLLHFALKYVFELVYEKKTALYLEWDELPP